MKLTLQRVTIINSVKNIKTAFLFKKKIFYNKKNNNKLNPRQLIIIFFLFFLKNLTYLSLLIYNCPLF